MEFVNENHRACYERVTDFMVQLYGESAQPNPDSPYFVLFEGSAAATTQIMGWGEVNASVLSYSYVVTDVETTHELCRYLLEENAKLRLGAFGIEDERTVVFQHGVSGDDLEKQQLAASVNAVRTTADDYDDIIVARFGGLTARELTRIPPAAPAPPEPAPAPTPET